MTRPNQYEDKELNNKIVIKKTKYGSTDVNPFNMGYSLRELSKMTGYDHAYLGKVKNGKIPITDEKLMTIMDKVTNAIVLGEELTDE